MPDATFNVSVVGDGVSFSGSIKRTASQLVQDQQTVGPAKTGTLTTRTDNDTGVITMTSGHGIVTSDVIDIYWTGGRRYGITASVTGNALTVDLGAGDNLPTVSTAVTVCKQVEIDIDLPGNDIVSLSSHMDQAGIAHFQDNSSTSLLVIDHLAKEPYLWATNIGVTNPLAGDTIGKVTVSTSFATSACTYNLKVLRNS